MSRTDVVHLQLLQTGSQGIRNVIDVGDDFRSDLEIFSIRRVAIMLHAERPTKSFSLATPDCLIAVPSSVSVL